MMAAAFVGAGGVRLRLRPRAPVVRAGVCRRRHRVMCAARADGVREDVGVDGGVDGGVDSGMDGGVGADAHGAADRAERARIKRLEAERLELLAEKARLEFERAELAADRKRLELDKVKAVRERREGIVPEVEDTAGEVPAEAATPTAEKSIGKGKGMTLPAASLSELLGVDFPRISEEDIATIRESVCTMTTFFVTDVDRSPFDERVVFRGNLRMAPDVLLDELEAAAERHGLADRVRLFLLVDPKEPSDGSGEDDRRPVLVALPAAALPNQTNAFSAFASFAIAIVAFGTTFSYGIGIFGLTPEVINQIAKGNVEQAMYTLPISLGALGIASVHEIAHRVAAKIRNVKIGLPYFIPSLQIGTYGTITPLESYPRERRDLFDFAASGPIAGAACSIAALVAGLVLTGSGDVADWYPQVPSALFHASILVGTIADFLLPAGVREQATLAVHPLTVVGYTGLLVNALNLMPIGRLDGGRIVQALYGRVVASRVTAVTLILQGLSSLFGNSPLLLFWGLICVFLQRESDYPCQNEVVEPDNVRTAIGLAALVLMLTVLIPFPDQIGDVLGRY